MKPAVDAEMIKSLRDRTGVSIGKCKEALEQSGNDMNLAIEWLRKAGIASAVKKESRDTKEGAIVARTSQDAVVLVEANAETDFVVQNERFKEFVEELTDGLLKKGDCSLDQLMNSPSLRDASLTFDQVRALVMQSLGENIRVRRIAYLPKKVGRSIALYSHMGGKILSVVEIDGAEGLEETLGRDIAMHVAAEAPEYLKPEDVPADLIEKEKEIAASQLKGKPANVIDKILEGKVRAFCEGLCLVCQKYVRDPSLSITDLLQQEGKKLGKQLTLVSFLRWQIGQ